MDIQMAIVRPAEIQMPLDISDHCVRCDACATAVLKSAVKAAEMSLSVVTWVKRPGEAQPVSFGPGCKFVPICDWNGAI